MSGGAVGQLTRLLAMVPWLLARPGVSVADAAREFGLSEDELRADLTLIFFCGLPGHMPDDLIDVSLDGDRIVISNADTIARPLRLAPDEAAALITALRSLADLPSPTGPDVVERTIAKLERAAGDAAEAHQHLTVSIEGGRNHGQAISDALRERRRLAIEYYVPARDEVTTREVDPLRLLVVDGQSYLEAWCLAADALRLFRLDRLQAVQMLDDPVEDHAMGDRDMADGVFDGAGAPWRLRLELTPQSTWLLDAYPHELVSESPTTVVDLPVADLGWARQLVLRLGGTARPIGPAELVSAVAEEAVAALSAY